MCDPDIKYWTTTFSKWSPDCTGQTSLISWLLMPWLQVSPGHQQPWYWLNERGMFSSCLRVNLWWCFLVEGREQEWLLWGHPWNEFWSSSFAWSLIAQSVFEQTFSGCWGVGSCYMSQIPFLVTSEKDNLSPFSKSLPAMPESIGYDYTSYMDYMDLAVRERPLNLITHLITHSSVNLTPLSAAYMHQRIRWALIKIMPCRLFGTKPLSKSMFAYCQFGR